MTEKNHFDFCILLSWSHHFDLSGMLEAIFFFFFFFLTWNINSTVSQRNKRKRADELLFRLMSLVGWRKRRRDLRQQPYPNPVIVQPDTNRQLVKETCSILDQKIKQNPQKKKKKINSKVEKLVLNFRTFYFYSKLFDLLSRCWRQMSPTFIFHCVYTAYIIILPKRQPIKKQLKILKRKWIHWKPQKVFPRFFPSLNLL